MDQKIRSSKELAYHLAHAQVTVSTCKATIVKMRYLDEHSDLMLDRIGRMLTDLEVIREQIKVKILEGLVVEDDTTIKSR